MNLQIKRLVVSVMISALLFALSACGSTPEGDNTGAKLDSPSRVSVHDPSIITVDRDGTPTHYIFGSHVAWAKSTDLQSWEAMFTKEYENPEDNPIYGNLSENLAESFLWAGENDADCRGGYAVWAPDVVWNDHYVNEDGSTGAYMMYYSASSTYIRSCIGFAVSQGIEGPYTYVDTVVYSGFTREDDFDDKSEVNKNYRNTNIQSLIDGGEVVDVSDNWFTGNGSYNNANAPNAIDPGLFFDTEGRLWMAYGSWSGGIFLLELDVKTGRAIYPGEDGETADGNTIDRYFGVKIAGGFAVSGEGPYIVYDESTQYYYLFMTYGGLAANGGYNMRLFRSEKPEGPYLDAKGSNAAWPKGAVNDTIGIKLMGNYRFSSMNVGYKAPGHNSAMIDTDGQWYLIHHTRFDLGSEMHEVRVRQMFMNEDGWPVPVPYEYRGDTMPEDGYTEEDITGAYEYINHGLASDGNMLKVQNIELKSDGTITGDVSGTWTLSGGYNARLVIEDKTYTGIFYRQQDESGAVNRVMTFSAFGENNVSVWGSKL